MLVHWIVRSGLADRWTTPSDRLCFYIGYIGSHKATSINLDQRYLFQCQLLSLWLFVCQQNDTILKRIPNKPKQLVWRSLWFLFTIFQNQLVIHFLIYLFSVFGLCVIAFHATRLVTTITLENKLHKLVLFVSFTIFDFNKPWTLSIKLNFM